MNQRIYERIREILETTPGLTQKGLAERMGLNPAAINRMLYGRRNIMAEEIPMIEDYLGVRLELSAPVVPANIEYRQEARHQPGRRGFSDLPAQPLPSSPEAGAAAHMVPVYGYAAGSLQKGLNLSNGDVVDWVIRHPAQFGITNAFAVYVFSDSMEPRYFRGELVYIHPGRPPEMNRDCIIEMKNGDAYIKRFLRQGEDRIRVAQFNPPEEKDIPKDEIKMVYAVVGRG
ncbi:MAG: helix-turn-helix domain-containing protein [Alphaproteobacteria bacterium]|nr:helix-turn-helix domain-containing protein [Alphaproteobacteria bacterium]